jgi:hypothetical protein
MLPSAEHEKRRLVEWLRVKLARATRTPGDWLPALHRASSHPCVEYRERE